MKNQSTMIGYIRILILVLTAGMISMKAYGQGQVYFNTIFGGLVDARVILPDGTGAGDGWTAQIWRETLGGEFEPVFPATTFRNTPAAARGYVEPIILSIPDVPIEEMATLIVRAFNGESWSNSTLRYESNPFTLRLEGGRFPPTQMLGLEFFTPVPVDPPPLKDPELTIRVVQSGRVITVANAPGNSFIIERSSVLGAESWERISLSVVGQKAQYTDNSNDPIAFFRMADSSP
ncbi:MAG: hypothetical protein O2960_27655 [Verrucomicrobia bacterium]|nr:hypothetical protein [Verrucomicrobiota bacterium]